ncbi:MAG: membrane protein insertase YidC [Candidatus Omnitrophica bacterium]|nr:membrane protein insertase YidC [Candidatus Omnitrophota bacterium]
MEKRVIIAIALSLFVLLIWSALMPKPPVVPPPPPQQTSPVEKTKQAIPAETPRKTEELPASTIGLDSKKITFVDSQAAIKDVIFEKYQDYRFPLKYGFFLNDNSLKFKKTATSDNTFEFVQSDDKKRITKRFIFSNSKYELRLEIEIQNLSQEALNFNTPLLLGVLDFASNQMQTKFEDITVAENDKVLHPNVHKDSIFNNLQFLAMRDRYFCAIIQPENQGFSAFVKKVSAQESEIGLVFPDKAIQPGQIRSEKFHIYLGPQELSTISSIKPEWSAVMYYGTFDIISQVLVHFIEFLHRLVHSWGITIILLSIFIYLLLYPLSVKQMRSMKEMQLIQPEIEKLRKLYKDNPQRLNKETIELYRKHKVNPFSGCLPLILQIPIFFALYQALIRSIALKGAHFLWIKDLSEADRLITLPVSLPLIGNEINILPILMALGMFVQQKITAAPTTDSNTADQQKLMLIILPIVFGFVFYHMPSGLVLYWFINSSLMLAYQLRTKFAK